MPVVGFVCGDRRMSFSDCLRLESRLAGEFQLPYPLLAIIAEQCVREHDRVSVTGCLGCLRRTYFSYTIDYYIEPTSMLQATYGTHLHRAIEECHLNEWLKEMRLSVDVDDFKLYGTIDAMFPIDGGYALVDFKFTSNTKDDRYLQNYVKQVQVYSHLANVNGYPIVRGYLLVMPTSQQYEQVYQYEIDVSRDVVVQTFEYVADRARALHSAFECGRPPSERDTRVCGICPTEIRSVCWGGM